MSDATHISKEKLRGLARLEEPHHFGAQARESLQRQNCPNSGINVEQTVLFINDVAIRFAGCAAFYRKPRTDFIAV